MTFFVPARRNSERFPRKNTANLSGKPLIAHTFDLIDELALIRDAGRVLMPTKTVVSSDDDDVLSMASQRGYEAVSRPERLCTSTAKMSDVLCHAVSHFSDDDVCVLYPTNPFRRAATVMSAILAFAGTTSPTSVMGVEKVIQRPVGLMSMGHLNKLALNRPDMVHVYQSQMQDAEYRANGALYLFHSKTIMNGDVDAQLFTEDTRGYIMDAVESFEIDEPEDMVMAFALAQINALEAIPCRP